MRGIGKIPPGWKVLPLKTFLRPRSESDEEELPLLSVYRDHGVVPFGSIEGNHNKPSLDLSTYKVVRAGDLVLNKMKTWQGSLAISGYEGLVSPAYVVCRVGGAWDKRYLHYLVRSPSYVAEYASLSYGVRVGQWDMRFEDFRDVLALQPPIEDQRRIADHLDTETARIDTLIDRKQGFIDLLVEKRTALITHAVTKGLDPSVEMKDSGMATLGEIPAHYHVCPFGKVASLQRGFDLPADSREPGPYPVVSSGGIVDHHAVGPVQPPGVVTGRYGSVGSVYWIEEAYWPHNTALYVRDYWGNNPRFVFWLLLSMAANITAAESGKSAVPGLDQKDTRGIRVARPPLVEQERIAEYVDAETSRLDVLINKTRHSNTLLREYRTALISAAVTGQIAIPGAEAAEDVA